MRLVTTLTVLLLLLFGTGQAALSKDNPNSRIAKQQAQAKIVICKVFGSYCQQALNVSWCESRWYIWAQNGQYRGLFQMGSSERRIYGHGPGAWEQSRAAKRYFIASGKDWSPWSCKP